MYFIFGGDGSGSRVAVLMLIEQGTFEPAFVLSSIVSTMLRYLAAASPRKSGPSLPSKKGAPPASASAMGYVSRKEW